MNSNRHIRHPSDDKITDQVLLAIRQITQAIDLHSRYLAKHYGLTGPQLIILKAIGKNGEMTVGELAKAISLSQSTVTGILARLENRGMIVRHKSLEDRRAVNVDLTDTCRRFLAEAPPPLQDRFLIAFNNLDSWEQLMILSALQRIVQLMNAEAIDAVPILAGGPIDLPDSPGEA
ncbi:MarR family winged helix-turn-helix transcriptional regulator [Desulfococcus multivorans]|jgi:DNA-binding MarR family transcriptional regulator|uniref:Transcriptional regulator, MarR family n=1 Tax=Desulfococcus multivorans DSM 2059 TaxID=1121405 RepID=S7TXU2_DESML|nr:MarR family winged helix-turn-helix transcriptional regulator [Desulfococcus multivorans]AQU99395.1 transcriptional regulator [Desulfococcus multivorans]EPR41867.1 transcriptional regulator, MarR family [Desulfococcus multivorans DSM 2059]MDX9817322.1 MarR family winged helix-turn-helix transcriptional regulator [Desulfococcus multivorans]SJZ93290.1 transcriptional regulator, MarR family [Desulfococcus multivorans DSM 2059]